MTMVLSCIIWAKSTLLVLLTACVLFSVVRTAHGKAASSNKNQSKANYTDTSIFDYYQETMNSTKNESNFTSISPTPFYNDNNSNGTTTTTTWSPSPTPFNGTTVDSFIPPFRSPFDSLNGTSTANSSAVWNGTNSSKSFDLPSSLDNNNITNVTDWINGTETNSSTLAYPLDGNNNNTQNETYGNETNSSVPFGYAFYKNETNDNETNSSVPFEYPLDSNETVPGNFNDTNSTASSDTLDDYNSTSANITLAPTPIPTKYTHKGKKNATHTTVVSRSPTNSPTSVTIVPFPKFDGHQFQPSENEEEVSSTNNYYYGDDAGTESSMVYSSTSAATDDDIQQSKTTKTVAIVLACVLIAVLTVWEIQRNPNGFCATLTYCVVSVIWYLVSTPIMFLWRFALSRATRRSAYHDADYFQEGSFQPSSRDDDLRYQPRSSRYIPRDLELS